MPLAPVLRLALKVSTVAAAGWALGRALRPLAAPGRTDQRAEDALDDLPEGLAVHRPQDGLAPQDRQTNTAWRARRVIRWGGRGVEIDAAILSRWRIRRL